MRGTLVSIDAWSRAAGARVTVRIGAALNSSTLGADGATWEPALSVRPRLSLQTMDDDLTGTVLAGEAEFTVNARSLRLVADAMQLDWKGSIARIYSGDGDRLADMRLEFVGRVTAGATNPDTGIAPLRLKCDNALIDVPLLTATYTGGGGIDGDAELRGNFRPAGFGRPINVKPILINATLNIYQVDGYGNLLSIAGVYENLAAFGASAGNYASYADLAAATIAEGAWATCLSQGLFRLGADPVGTITCDPVCGYDRPGTMMLRWLRTHAGVTDDRIVITSFDSLTTQVNNAVGGAPLVSYWTSDEGNVLDLMQRMCASCNASLLLLFNGSIAVTRVVGGAEALTLNRQGGSPSVLAWQQQDPPTPWWRLRMAAARSYYVNSPAEIDYEDEIRPMGNYDAAQSYRQGMVVRSLDGSEWIYSNPTPSVGNAPPTWPTLSNTWWTSYTAPIDLSAINDKLDKIASDAYLSSGEKPQAVIDRNALANQINALNSRYTALGSPADITAAYTAANTAMTALDSYLNALTPSWTDSSTNTPVVPATYVTKWGDAYSAAATFSAAITGRKGPAVFTLLGNGAFTPNTITKSSGTGGSYDTQGYSQEGWRGGCQLSFRVPALSALVCGINTDPATDAAQTGIDYAFDLLASGALRFRDNSALVTSAFTYAANDVFQITYDNAKVRWYQNGVLRREATPGATGIQFYLDSSIATLNASIADIAFSAQGQAGTSSVAVSANPEAVQIQGTASGAAASGALPVTITNSATQAGAAVTITSVAIVSTEGCTASVPAGTTGVQISAVSAQSGSVVYNVTAAGQTVKKTVTFVVVSSGGAGGTSSSLLVGANVSSTTYAQNGGTITLAAPSSGKISVNLTGGYKAGTSDIRLQTKLQYRVAAGTFADVASSENIGTQAYYDTSEPGAPARSISGGVNGSGPYLLTGLTSGSTYELRAMARKFDGAASTTSSVNLLLYMEQTA